MVGVCPNGSMAQLDRGTTPEGRGGEEELGGGSLEHTITLTTTSIG